LHAVLYGWETWSVILREEVTQRLSENRMMRRIFVPKRNEITGEWRKLNNEINYLHPSPHIIRVIKKRRMKWVGHVVRMGGEERCIQSFGGKA